MKKGLLMTALITGTFMCASTGAFAEELQEYTLDQMVVTATRTEARELEVPAAVSVINAKEIENSGAKTAYEVIERQVGFTNNAYGPGGREFGGSSTRTVLRGLDKGTLVMVNGAPINMMNYNSMEGIPVEAVEKIEIVRGAQSVLYGAEATGGVINIITKKAMSNTVKVAAGNFGKQRYNVSVGADKFNIVAGYEKRGKADNMSGYIGKPTAKTTVYDYGKGDRKSVLWNWKMLDGLTFTHSYSNNKHEYWQKKALSGERTQNNYYEDTDNMFLLQYDKDGLKANLSYGTQEKSYDQSKFAKGSWSAKSPYSWRKGHNTNIDLQKTFDMGENKLLVGAGYQKEDMDLFSSSKNNNSTYQRDNYSVYASYDWKVSDKSNLIFNARETWATGCDGYQKDNKTGNNKYTHNDNLSKFTPELQYIYKVNDESSFYAKIGKSFRLPNLTQLFGNGNMNPALDLKPEQGTHYEIGYKSNIGKGNLRFAVFNYKIKDSIDADVKYDKDGAIDEVDYFNEDVKNTGVELSYAIKHDDNWSTRWGATYQNPKAQNIHNYGDMDWHQIYNKYQLQGAVDYTQSKFAASMSVNFVGDRMSTRASITKPQREIKP